MVFCINIIFLKLLFLGLDNENWSGTPSKKVNCPNFRLKKNETEVLNESNSNEIRIKRKSAVHEHYNRVKILHLVTKKPIDGAVCKICKSQFTSRVSTNLKSHLKRKHPETYEEVMFKDNQNSEVLIWENDDSELMKGEEGERNEGEVEENIHLELLERKK